MSTNHDELDYDMVSGNLVGEHATANIPTIEVNSATASNMANGKPEDIHLNAALEFQKQQHIESTVQQQEAVRATTTASRMPVVPEMSNDWIDSLLPVPTLDPRTDIRANAFAQFVQGWENYMNDDGLIDPFPNFQQPLQMLQGLSLCGHPAILPRLEANKVVNAPLAVHPVAPSVLRYTYSSPSQIHGRKSSVFDSSLTGFNVNHINDQFPPPPVALDPFQRSSSTPSAFRQHTSSYSAFGTRDRSAFTTTSRFNDFVPVGRESSCFSTFGPVDFYSMALEDMERTSIEVQDISDCIADTTAGNMIDDRIGSKRGAASRAAKFLKDIRVLRRRRKFRGGRENPVQPTLDTTFGSKSSDDDAAIGNDQFDARPIDTAVTVFTETLFNPNDNSFLSGSSEVSAIAQHAADNDGTTDIEDILFSSPCLNLSHREDVKDEIPEKEQQYQQLDSDIEEEVGYQRIETQLQSTSPPLMEMKDQSHFINSVCRSGESITTVASSTKTVPIKVQVSTVLKPRFAMSMEGIAASPSPTQMDIGDNSNLTPLSHESIDMSLNTTRSVSSSGHTTQATLPSNSTGQQSGLSTISETDREVMEANKDAKRRRGLDSLVKKYNKVETDGSSNNSSSSNSTNPHRYFSLAGSPDVPREGAVVPIDRFFVQSTSLLPIGQPAAMSRASTTSTSTGSRRSESTTSPTTTASIPVTHASSSSASSREEPPTFVSYFGQDSQASKLITFREEIENSSQRTSDKDLEEREASPASEMMEYRNLATDEVTVSSQLRGPRFGRIRSRQQRPPRFPPKSLRATKTPPPFGAVSPLHHQQQSPPRKIVDLPVSNVSRPMVLRSSSDPLPSMSHSHQLKVTGAQLLPVMESASPNLAKSRTYQERNVEVMDMTVPGETDSATNLVSPEKC